MGKHSAPKAATQTVLPAGSSAQPRAAAPRKERRTVGPVSAVLAQTVAFGALAVVVAVVALTWAGVGGREAAAVGVGLLVVGAIVFLVVRRTGMLEDAPVETPGPPTAGL